MSLCTCGHERGEHHIVYWIGSVNVGGTADECEIYGSNEYGGKMPAHESGEVCPHAGIWYQRDENGIWRAPDGSTQEDHECEEPHTWVDHCHHYEES